MTPFSSRLKHLNVFINAMATMLIYTSFFAGTMLMPTVLKGTIDEQTVFYSMAVHSLTACVSCPAAMFMIKHFGAKLSLIIGSICCVFFYISIMIPNSIAIYATQSIFGFGLALVRPASLKFLVRNSSPDNMGRDSGIHWGIFMSSMIWGNAVVYVVTHGQTEVDYQKRMMVYAILGSLTLLGTIGYVLVRSPPRPVGERAPLLDGMKEDLNPRSCGNLLKETFSLVILKQTVWLVPSMAAAGFYFTMYCVEIPTMLGENIALFGMVVGVGELVGSLVLGKILSVFGYVLITILSGTLAVISLLLTCTSLPKDSESAILNPPSLAILLAVALAYGVSDAGNNLSLNTIIGRLFSERSEVIFCVLSCVMNLAAMTWYFIYTVVAWETIIVATGLSVLASMIGIFIVVRPK